MHSNETVCVCVCVFGALIVAQLLHTLTSTAFFEVELRKRCRLLACARDTTSDDDMVMMMAMSVVM